MVSRPLAQSRVCFNTVLEFMGPREKGTLDSPRGFDLEANWLLKVFIPLNMGQLYVNPKVIKHPGVNLVLGKESLYSVFCFKLIFFYSF